MNEYSRVDYCAADIIHCFSNPIKTTARLACSLPPPSTHNASSFFRK